MFPKHPSPLLRPHREMSPLNLSAEIDGKKRAEKDTHFRRNLRRIIAGVAAPAFPARSTPQGTMGPTRRISAWLPFFGCGVTPMRQSLLDDRPTVDPAGPRRGANPTVQLPINPREPCEFRWAPIPAEAVRGLSHFHNCRGRGFALMVNDTGIEPATFRLLA